jgi:hypothetical protein
MMAAMDCTAYTNVRKTDSFTLLDVFDGLCALDNEIWFVFANAWHKTINLTREISITKHAVMRVCLVLRRGVVQTFNLAIYMAVFSRVIGGELFKMKLEHFRDGPIYIINNDARVDLEAYILK